MLSQTGKELALGLFDIHAVKFGEFRLKLHEHKPDSPLSPIYIDLRLLRSYPKLLGVAADIYEELATDLVFDLLADVPTAATPIVGVLAYRMGIPMVSPRSKTKGHGTEQSVEGAFTTGQTALLVDDLITTAGSKLAAMTILRQCGLKVQDVIVLVDRQQGGQEELALHDCHCHSAFQLGDLLEFYRAAGKLSENDYQRTLAYLKL